MYFCVMAKQIKEQIKCKDCKFKGPNNMQHLNPDKKPILCACKKYDYLVLIDHINKNCQYNTL